MKAEVSENPSTVGTSHPSLSLALEPGQGLGGSWPHVCGAAALKPKPETASCCPHPLPLLEAILTEEDLSDSTLGCLFPPKRMANLLPFRPLKHFKAIVKII